MFKGMTEWACASSRVCRETNNASVYQWEGWVGSCKLEESVANTPVRPQQMTPIILSLSGPHLHLSHSKGSLFNQGPFRVKVLEGITYVAP